jgi:hypothetical protein
VCEREKTKTRIKKNKSKIKKKKKNPRSRIVTSVAYFYRDPFSLATQQGLQGEYSTDNTSYKQSA